MLKGTPPDMGLSLRLYMPMFDGGLRELSDDDDEVPWQIIACPKSESRLLYMNKDQLTESTPRGNSGHA